ncbi:sulfotransferase family protein [Solihabitans fulvus]|uniref:Sulfotransferase family protein n=1 Tax=Solihabitans fulvus TaxID=1892852 RepID=A0A5B2XDN6_9PSEU|nr:sulfotransferase family protein [Solihabitans fulvus]KAA2261463.1 sulfotransferase family protein [Solihabitans fulvus]
MNERDRDGLPVIALWSAPRSRSTAFLRMIMEWEEVTTLHEPFSSLVHFGTSAVADTTAGTEAELIAAIRDLAGHTTVFFKDTTDYAYPGLLADRDFLGAARHTFIIRHPREVIPSHFALHPGLTRDEVGFARLHELYLAVVDATGAEPVVVDADDLVTQPEAVVRAYCERVGLPFDADRLSWQPRMPEEWRKTERWHLDAGQTGAFVRTETAYEATVDNHPRLAEFYEYHLPFYEYLLTRRLSV